jgi:two-component system CheB/CheR fusion protein
MLKNSDKSIKVFHNDLNRQINELLPESLRNDPALQPFLERMNDSYMQWQSKAQDSDTPGDKISRTDKEKIFNSLVNNLKNGILLVDSRGKIIDCNTIFLETCNSQLTREAFHRQHKSYFTNADHFEDEIKRLVRERVAHFDEIVENKAGNFFERDYSPIYLDDKYIGHLWVYRDITARKKIQDYIYVNEFTQRQVLNSALDAIIIVNEKGVIELWNPQAEKILGWNQEEALNKYLTDKIQPLGLTEREKHHEPIFPAGVPHNKLMELRTENKSGEELLLEISVIPIKYYSKIYFCAFIRNVTERKKMEEEILRQKKFTEDILNNLPADIAVFDLDHKYLYVNPKGIQNDETRAWIIGKDDFDYYHMKGLNQDSALKRREYFNQAVESGERVQWVDEVRSKTNERSYILRNYYPYIENGRLKYVFGYGIDVTELKDAQSQLKEALDDLREINQELEQFAYIISHDLQEPLRMVKSFLQLLEKKISDKLDETDKQYISYATNGADRMKRLIQDLLEYSRIGSQKEAITDVDCNLILAELNNLFSLNLKESNTTLNISPLPVIRAMKPRIFQLFQNLIGNSLKYQNREIREHTISVGCTETEDDYRFYVKDNGIGIDPKYFEKIFILFQRLDHKRDESSGTGIGLAICKKIVEQHNGKIWVESEPSKGSVFYFTISKNQIKDE